jgi:hypothetical protein
MKYQKGTFVVVPNKEHLKGKPSELQTLFFWLCEHADLEGICYPSRVTLAEEAGCGLKSVDKYLKQLVKMGLIEKTTRQKPNSNENTSNLYQVVVAEMLPPSSKKATTPSSKKDPVTIPNTNEPLLTVIAAQELPLKFGNTPALRLMGIYSTLFQDKYGFVPSIVATRHGKQLSSLLKNYTEWQVALLLIIFFEWRGMTGADDFAEQSLTKVAHPVGWFTNNLSQYEAYLRNVAEVKMDDPETVHNIVSRTMDNIINGKA